MTFHKSYIPPNTTTRARHLRQSLTDAETRLWKLLRSRQFETIKFRRQHPIGPYILDFACVAYRIGIECDGSQHAYESNRAHDRKRTAYLEEQGWVILRFWNHDILSNAEGLLQALTLTLSQRERELRLPPTLSLLTPPSQNIPAPLPPLPSGEGRGEGSPHPQASPSTNQPPPPPREAPAPKANQDSPHPKAHP